MNLEAQLLQIIEQQQQQLKEQQKQQEQALQLIQTQSKTISELESYCNKLITHFNTLTEKEKEMKNHIRQLQNPKLSETLLQNLESSLKTAITEPFRAISDWVKSKERDQRTIANDDLYRNREADSTIDPTASKETRLSATVSRKIRGFDQTNIFKALDELDRRRELQLEQQRKMTRVIHLDFNTFFAEHCPCNAVPDLC